MIKSLIVFLKKGVVEGGYLYVFKIWVYGLTIGFVRFRVG